MLAHQRQTIEQFESKMDNHPVDTNLNMTMFYLDTVGDVSAMVTAYHDLHQFEVDLAQKPDYDVIKFGKATDYTDLHDLSAKVFAQVAAEGVQLKGAAPSRGFAVGKRIDGKEEFYSYDQ
jgi:hypothetical protein